MLVEYGGLGKYPTIELLLIAVLELLNHCSGHYLYTNHGKRNIHSNPGGLTGINTGNKKLKLRLIDKKTGRLSRFINYFDFAA
jgi:hypothetical protein